MCAVRCPTVEMQLMFLLFSGSGLHLPGVYRCLLFDFDIIPVQENSRAKFVVPVSEKLATVCWNTKFKHWFRPQAKKKKKHPQGHIWGLGAFSWKIFCMFNGLKMFSLNKKSFLPKLSSFCISCTLRLVFFLCGPKEDNIFHVCQSCNQTMQKHMKTPLSCCWTFYTIKRRFSPFFFFNSTCYRMHWISICNHSFSFKSFRLVAATTTNRKKVQESRKREQKSDLIKGPANQHRWV